MGVFAAECVSDMILGCYVKAEMLLLPMDGMGST